MSLISWIQDQMASDDDDQSRRLANLYHNATPEQKTAIDDAFTCLCGWTLATAISEATAECWCGAEIACTERECSECIEAKRTDREETTEEES